jgi:hypothetical protein
MKLLLTAWRIAATFTGTMWFYYSDMKTKLYQMNVTGVVDLATELLWQRLFIWVNIACFGLLLAMTIGTVVYKKIKGWEGRGFPWRS